MKLPRDLILQVMLFMRREDLYKILHILKKVDINTAISNLDKFYYFHIVGVFYDNDTYPIRFEATIRYGARQFRCILFRRF
jgi:hypothetical protein